MNPLSLSTAYSVGNNILVQRVYTTLPLPEEQVVTVLPDGTGVTQLPDGTLTHVIDNADGSKSMYVDSVAAKWVTRSVLPDGTTVTTNHCSITLVSEYLANITGQATMLTLGLIASTPHGWMVSWDVEQPPPEGCNQWCIDN